MKMLDLKPYGAFIEHTLRPMIEEAKSLLSDLYGYGIHLDKDDIARVTKLIASKHIKVVIIQSITNIIICGVVCYTLWKIYPSVYQ